LLHGERDPRHGLLQLLPAEQVASSRIVPGPMCRTVVLVVLGGADGFGAGLSTTAGTDLEQDLHKLCAALRVVIVAATRPRDALELARGAAPNPTVWMTSLIPPAFSVLARSPGLPWQVFMPKERGHRQEMGMYALGGCPPPG